MRAEFSSFVILADMRTGSNALEEKLNAFDQVVCHGEVFNPHFIGHANKDELFGVTLAGRDANPSAMLQTLRENSIGIGGFRLFSDHDPRVLDLCLTDESCAKIILTRNPLDSYVSLKIARKTGQWWLGDMKNAKSAKVAFDAAEFERYLAARAEHLQKIHRTLQVSGQAAFAVHYDDLFDDAVIEGLASFLGAPGDQKSLRKQGKIQNPKPLSAKVSNFGEMTRALANRDPFNLDRLAIYEPRRGPNVPAFVTAKTAPLLYLPIKCADDQRVLAWMARLDGIDPGEMASGHNQKTLRQWMRKTRRHTSFSVISHPLARAHQAFCRHILSDGDAAYPAIRNVLRRSYKLPIPDDANDPSYDLSAHHEAFLAFLTFLEGNLGGQTSIRVDGAWATQTAVLQGMATIIVPQKVVHSDDLIEGLTELCAPFEAKVPDLPKPKPYFRFRLEDIYDEVLEKAARRAYRRDFMMFGFESWR